MFHIHPGGGKPVTKERFEAELGRLLPELLNTQFALKAARRRVVVLVGGIEGAGKGEVVWQINQWLDPRGVETNGSLHPGDGIAGRPEFWRHNLNLPARGRVGVLFGAWYSEVFLRRLNGDLKRKAFEKHLETIRRFEHTIATDGTVFLKLWLNISRKTLKARLKNLSSHPELHLTLLPVGRQLVERHDDLVEIAEQTMRRTHSAEAPWHLVDATDPRRRSLVVARLLLEALKRAEVTPAKPAKPPARRRPVKLNALAEVDLDARLEKEDYEEKLDRLQEKMLRLAWRMFEKKRSCLLVFEGWDAAGKGGAIRRVTQALDPRLYQVTGFAAPTDEEKAQHYLWRFWRRLPPSGLTAIFDRSHYGRVLVERVEGFARPEEWQRAYDEINDFEAQLIDGGYIIRKFWLHISPEEQLRRFKLRERIRIKRYKITKEDWRNRAKWKPYEEAVNEMVVRTSPEHAPWNVVPANDKRFARIAVLKTVCDALEQALG